MKKKKKPTAGQRMIESARQALAFARGEENHGCEGIGAFEAGGVNALEARAAAERIRARAETLRAGAFNWDDLKADRDGGWP